MIERVKRELTEAERATALSRHAALQRELRRPDGCSLVIAAGSWAIVGAFTGAVLIGLARRLGLSDDADLLLCLLSVVLGALFGIVRCVRGGARDADALPPPVFTAERITVRASGVACLRTEDDEGDTWFFQVEPDRLFVLQDPWLMDLEDEQGFPHLAFTLDTFDPEGTYQGEGPTAPIRHELDWIDLEDDAGGRYRELIGGVGIYESEFLDLPGHLDTAVTDLLEYWLKRRQADRRASQPGA